MTARRKTAGFGLSVMFLTLLIGGTIAPAQAAQAGPTVRVEPAELNVDPGETFELQVMIDGVQDLGGFELTITYDPAVIEVEEAGKGEYLGSTGRMALDVGPEIDAEGGSVALGALSLGEEAGPDGSGVLVTVSARALQEGTSAVALEEVDVFSTIPERMSVQIEGGVVTVGGADTAPGEAPETGTGRVPWVWIAGGGALAVVAAVAAAIALRRGRARRGSATDQG